MKLRFFFFFLINCLLLHPYHIYENPKQNDETFKKYWTWNSYYNMKSKDLYFIGIKKGATNEPVINVPNYKSDKVLDNKKYI